MEFRIKRSPGLDLSYLGIWSWTDSVLFMLRTKSEIIQRVSLLHHSYADDTQFYIAFEKKDSLCDIESCVRDQIIYGTQYVNIAIC